MLKNALIVEDEEDLGILLAEHLRRLEFAPTHLTEGKHAVAWTRAHCPDLILLDLMLPDADGYDICRQLKLDRRTNLIPIIMVTARSEHQDRIRGLAVGANFYLTKPFDDHQLFKAIDEVFLWRENLKKRGSEGEIHFQFRSDTHYLEELNHLLASLFLFTPLSQKQITQLTTVIRELGMNAIEWGHKRQKERLVTVTYLIDPEKVTIHIKDTGPGFNPGHLPHASKPDDPLAHLEVREQLGLREGGFGIVMAKGMVDELQYLGRGNEVRLVKYFDPQSQEKK